MHEKHQQAYREQTKIRVNAKGGGRPPKLTIAEQVCLCLFYLRHLPTFEVLGIQFEVSKTEANDTFHYWLAVLRKLLPASLLEQLGNEASKLEMVLELLSEFRLIVDSTEQPRQRPGDQKEQQKCFSGKKKQHTFKNQVLALPEGKEIVDVIVGVTGSTSDISLFRTQQQKFVAEQEFEGDKAYVGAPQMTTPHKKPRKRELTEQQKAENKIFSSQRIFVEHLIRLVKLFRVAKERFRLHPDTYKSVILTVCGLVRLRLGTLVLPVLS